MTARTIESARPRRDSRSLFRFNLWALLIALLVVTIYFGVRQRFVVSVEENRAKRQLLDGGASYGIAPPYPVWIQYALLQFGDDAHHVNFVSFPPHSPGDPIPAKQLTAEDLAPLTRLRSLREVDLWGSKFEGEALATLQRCKKLQKLDLSSSLLDDAAIDRLAGHPTLEVVRIEQTLTTDAALKTLASLPNLTEIAIDDATTAEGIAALATAPRLARVDAYCTALRSSDLQVLVDRGVSVKLHEDFYRPPKANYDDEFWSAHRESTFVTIEAERLTDDEILDGLSRTTDVHTVNVHGDDTIDPEALAGLLSNDGILEIYLDVRGVPLRYEAIEAVARRMRPADADPCIVYGNIVATGDELIRECEKVRRVKRRPTGMIYAPYVIKELPPEHVARLSALAPGCDITIQPHASGHPLLWVRQSELLEDLSPIFVPIPIP